MEQWMAKVEKNGWLALKESQTSAMNCDTCSITWDQCTVIHACRKLHSCWNLSQAGPKTGQLWPRSKATSDRRFQTMRAEVPMSKTRNPTLPQVANTVVVNVCVHGWHMQSACRKVKTQPKHTPKSFLSVLRLLWTLHNPPGVCSHCGPQMHSLQRVLPHLGGQASLLCE